LAAEAGENQSIHVGELVYLDGSGSYDEQTATEDLGYDWAFLEVPPGSTAALTGADTMTPSFEADAVGDYRIRLIVDDGELSSEPDEVMVSTFNTPPNADAGEDQGILVGTIADLDGSGSHDPDEDLLSYGWTIEQMPEGSATVLNNPETVNPWLHPELPGAYDIKLTVDDGYATDEDMLTVLATALDDYVCERMTESVNLTAGMPEAGFTTKGNKKALGNFLRLGCESSQLDELEEAQHKLEQALSRTDGCALCGEPDLGGGGPGPKKDFVIDCLDQAQIYPLILEALEAIAPPLP
jgi:hypothetical protein